MAKNIIQKNYSLLPFNTFGIAAKASNFMEINSLEDLNIARPFTLKQDWFILGGGSNILITRNFKGLVLKNNLLEKNLVREYKNCVHVAIGAGENWHQFVLWTIENSWGGVENLSLIPGTVGAAPIQNIGAYGIELKDVFHKLEAVNMQTGKTHIFKKEDCQFGYRESIFKKKLKGKYFITKVFFKLSKNPIIDTSYGAIQKVLNEQKIQNPSIRDVSNAVIQIRSNKLPNPSKIGNAGSFFKNPFISKTKFQKLQKQFPRIVYYSMADGKIKIPAAWLIEQCGWKGKRVGNTGCYKNQALVLVNYGNATGREVKNLAHKIIKSVDEKFGITLQMEVNLI